MLIACLRCGFFVVLGLVFRVGFCLFLVVLFIALVCLWVCVRDLVGDWRRVWFMLLVLVYVFDLWFAGLVGVLVMLICACCVFSLG